MDFAVSALAARPMQPTVAPTFAGVLVGETSWTNPAAAAALRSTVDLLQGIEDGIVRNYGSSEKVRAYAIDLRSTNEIFETAHAAIVGDTSKENDAFLPLLATATGGVTLAEGRLSSKDITNTWPTERGDILAAIRRARAIGQNVADQLDPRTPRDPR